MIKENFRVSTWQKRSQEGKALFQPKRNRYNRPFMICIALETCKQAPVPTWKLNRQREDQIGQRKPLQSLSRSTELLRDPSLHREKSFNRVETFPFSEGEMRLRRERSFTAEKQVMEAKASTEKGRR